MAKKPGKSKKGTALRAQAEKLLLATKQDVAAMPLKNVQELVHELQVHQIELNMQNDELRRTEVKLEAARDRYVDLYDFSPTAHLTMDRRGAIVEANLRAATLLGMNRKDLIGQPLARFFASEDQDIFHRHCQDVLKTGTRQNRDIRLRNQAGAISWVQLESLAMHDESGPITHWRTALLDISDRKEAEQAKNLLIKDLNRSEEYFRALFNWTPSAVGISTVAEGRLCDVNEAFSRLTGYDREELIGRTTLELGLWADPSERATVLRELQEQGSLHNREGRFRTKSGEIRSLMVSVDPIQLGSTPCLIYLAHDMTDRKRAEEALRLAKFSIDRAADAIYWIDPQARILDANEAASLMLGYSNDELRSMTVHDLNPDFQADMWPGFWAETRKPGTKVIETCHQAKNGRLIPVEVTINFLSHEGKEYHCAFVHDITDRKHGDEQLRATLEEVRLLSGRLVTAQEEERTRIARELHDELGVGLTCLKIALSRLVAIVGGDIGGAARAKLDDKVCSMVEQVDGTIASVQRLVTQLRPALLDDLGLVAAIEWQCRDFQKRTGIPCACVTSADDIAMEPERARALFRICQEALTNTARHAQATAVAVKLESHNDVLQLVVADNGVGISDTKVSDRRSLGLLGMRERAALFGGELTIQGHPEKGTTVTTCLPRCPA